MCTFSQMCSEHTGQPIYLYLEKAFITNAFHTTSSFEDCNTQQIAFICTLYLTEIAVQTEKKTHVTVTTLCLHPINLTKTCSMQVRYAFSLNCCSTEKILFTSGKYIKTFDPIVNPLNICYCFYLYFFFPLDSSLSWFLCTREECLCLSL